MRGPATVSVQNRASQMVPSLGQCSSKAGFPCRSAVEATARSGWPHRICARVCTRAYCAVTQGFRHIIPSADIDTCKRVVAAVNRCGGLSWGYHVSIHNRTARTDTACLAVLLPTLNTCTSVSFSLFDVHITPELLTLLSANLAKCAFKRVSLHECTWGIGVWPMLLPSLPHARLKIETDMLQEEWVKEMCVHATQPVELDIFCRGLGRGARGQAWQDGWSERVQDAMTAAGHQHVKLTTRFTQWF